MPACMDACASAGINVEEKRMEITCAKNGSVLVMSRASLIGVVVGLLVAPGGVWSQAQPVPSTAPSTVSQSAPPTQQSAEIVVTGSRIRGVGAVGSNVVTVGADLIEMTAPLSVADLLKQVPQIVNLGYDESSFSSTTGIGNVTRAAGVNVHGLGPQATLVLYNGHRFSMQGPQGSFVDPSSIPTVAIERVEVVPDGASAIYGSDAVAGVVNFIPRQSYDGVMLTARGGTSSHYDQQQASGIAGK